MFESALSTRRVLAFPAFAMIVACTLASLAVRAEAAQRWGSRPGVVRDATYTRLYDFPSNPTQGGVSPDAPLSILDGLLYGTTFNGGLLTKSPCEEGCGTVFSITKQGAANVVTGTSRLRAFSSTRTKCQPVKRSSPR